MTGDVRVRPATAADRDAILALPGLGGSTRRTLDTALTAADHRCLVAEVAGLGGLTGAAGPAEVAGFAVGMLLLDEAHVVDIAVAAAARRRGIATRLLATLDADLRARGAVATTLEVRASNDAAQALYRRLGFVAEGRRMRYYPDGDDAVVMWRRNRAREEAS